jgi:hypothetical protein
MSGRYRAALASAVIALGLLVAPPAQASTPPTLTGELFTDPAPTINATCDPNGISTVSFSASGVATGPYPGTFTEVGTATIGPQTLSPGGGQSTGTLLSFDAVFAITSGSIDIAGTKTLSGPVTDPATQVAIGQCNTFGPVQLVDVIARFTVGYQATIMTGDAAFADRGVIPLVAVQRATQLDVTPPVNFFQVFSESFSSSLSAPEPLTTPGLATGGGQVPAETTFGFTAKSDASGVKGNCTVIDRVANTMVKCTDATSYIQSGTHATFFGHATVNGVTTSYRIDVNDVDDSGAGSDSFSITTGTGYNAGGILTQGNIQVHH